MLRSQQRGRSRASLPVLVLIIFSNFLRPSTQDLVDNPIRCPYELPRPGLFDWPSTERPLSSFESLDQLCAFKNFGDSMGCWCLGLSGPRYCFQPVADIVLWMYEPLRNYCKELCKCPLEGVGEHDMSHVFRDAQNAQDDESVGDFDPERDRDRDTSTSRNRKHKQTGTSSFVGRGKAQGNSLSVKQPIWDITQARNERLGARPRSCGKECKNFQCTGRGNDCQCAAIPQDVSGGIWTLFGCRHQPKLFPKIRRRSLGSDLEVEGDAEERWPCPCNGTYVSYACCDVQDGLVWEDKDRWLGRLDTDDL